MGNFFEELFKLKLVEFPRCIKPSNAIGDPTLVIFSDGSGDAYGAVAYARWMTKDGTYKAQLIASKNRIAPVKIVDIVRLELSGAVIAKRLRVFIQTEVRYTFTAVYHIVDSEMVKAMISKEIYGFNTFAANRIGEIQQKTDPQELFWTASDLNIADWEIETLAARIDIDRFSKIELLKNTTARILKLYKQYKKSAGRSAGSAVEMGKLTVAFGNRVQNS